MATAIPSPATLAPIVCAFGAEDMSYISDESLYNYLCRGEFGVMDLVKDIYMNPEHAENWTVLPNRKIRSEVLVSRGNSGPDSRSNCWHYADAKVTASDIQKRIFNLLYRVLSPRLYSENVCYEYESQEMMNMYKFLQNYLMQIGRNYNAMNKRIIMEFVNFKPKDHMKEAEDWLAHDA
jgi:hypothetical protein